MLICYNIIIADFKNYKITNIRDVKHDISLKKVLYFADLFADINMAERMGFEPTVE